LGVSLNIVAYLGGSRGNLVLLSLIKRSLSPKYVFVKQASSLDGIKEICESNSINFSEVDRKFPIDHLDLMSKISPDIFVVSGFNLILPSNLLSIPKYGGINCHAGRLPEYRGASVIPWQIINGEIEGEAYVLEMTKGIDDGDILAKEAYSIDKHETSRHIVKKVNSIFANLIPQVVESYLSNPDKIYKTSQDNIKACTWTQRSPKDGVIKWSELTATEVVNFVRALDHPYPGAFTYLSGEHITIHSARVHPKLIKGVPGKYVGVRDKEITIIAADRAVAVLDYSIMVKSEAQNKPFLRIGDTAKNE